MSAYLGEITQQPPMVGSRRPMRQRGRTPQCADITASTPPIATRLVDEVSQVGVMPHVEEDENRLLSPCHHQHRQHRRYGDRMHVVDTRMYINNVRCTQQRARRRILIGHRTNTVADWWRRMCTAPPSTQQFTTKHGPRNGPKSATRTCANKNGTVARAAATAATAAASVANISRPKVWPRPTIIVPMPTREATRPKLRRITLFPEDDDNLHQKCASAMDVDDNSSRDKQDTSDETSHFLATSLSSPNDFDWISPSSSVSSSSDDSVTTLPVSPLPTPDMPPTLGGMGSSSSSSKSNMWQLSQHWLGAARDEICGGCGQPFVLADHSGMLKCFNRTCQHNHQRIFVTDGDVQHLPFGADTMYHGVFGQKSQDAYVVFRPVVKQVVSSSSSSSSAQTQAQHTVHIELVQVNATNTMSGDVSSGGAPGVDVGGGMASANAATAVPKRDTNMAHLEVVFGYAKRVKRTQANTNTNGLAIAGTMVTTQGNTTSTTTTTSQSAPPTPFGTNGSNGKNTTKPSPNGTAVLLRRKDCLKLPDNKLMLASDYEPDTHHINALRIVLCDNTCRKRGNNECARWGHAIQSQIEIGAQSKPPTSPLPGPADEVQTLVQTPSQKHARCTWFDKPINIAELRIVANKLCDASHMACAGLRPFLTNAYFLQKLYLSVYDRVDQPPRLSDVELKRANILFQEALARTSPNAPALIAINTKRVPATFIWSKVFEHMFPQDLITRQLFACPTNVDKFKALMTWWTATRDLMPTAAMMTHYADDGTSVTPQQAEVLLPHIKDRHSVHILP